MFRLHPILRSLLPAGLVLLASLAVMSGGVPQLVRVMAPAIVALAAGLALGRGDAAELAARRGTEARAEAAEEANARLVKAAGEMRHDLRGILSPALLTADRLTTSQDLMARRAGETMVATIDRAEQRLRRSDA